MKKYKMKDQTLTIETEWLEKEKELWVGFILNNVEVNECFFELNEYSPQSKKGDMKEFKKQVKKHIDYLNKDLTKEQVKHFKTFDLNRFILANLKEGE